MKPNKTTQNDLSVEEFIETVSDPERQADCRQLCVLMEQASGFPPRMWGTAIIGFGSYHYKYESGREGDAPLAGFSPRKNEFALYLASSFDRKEELLARLGKHRTGKGCLYLKKVSDIDMRVLKEMIPLAIRKIQLTYPEDITPS